MKYPMDHKIKRPFVYTSAAATAVEKTLDKERKRLAKLAEEEKARTEAEAVKVARRRIGK